MRTFIELLVSGVLIGGSYALAGVGMSLVWGVMNVINLAQPAYLMLGAYTSVVLWDDYKWNPVFGALVAAVTIGLLGALVQQVLINRVVTYGLLMPFILTFGLGLFLQNVASASFSAQIRTITIPGATDSISIGGLDLNVVRLEIFAIAVLVVLALQQYMNRTRTGILIQATALDSRGASLCGVNAKRMFTITAGIAAASAGLCGGLIASLSAVSPDLGTLYVGRMFAVAILAGLGSVGGALAGGIALGVLESVLSGYIGPEWRDVVAFGVVVAVLVLRPSGIAGRAFFAEI